MTLAIERSGGERYEIRDRWRVTGTEPIGRGSDLCVQIDPDNRHKVAIDWERTRAEFHDDVDKRRKLMQIGVPVPTTSIRANAEKAGYEPWTAGPKEPEVPEAEQLLTLAPAAEAAAEAGEERDEVAQGDLIANLARLATLHETGALTDGEFEAAKQHVLTHV